MNDLRVTALLWAREDEQHFAKYIHPQTVLERAQVYLDWLKNQPDQQVWTTDDREPPF